MLARRTAPHHRTPSGRHFTPEGERLILEIKKLLDSTSPRVIANVLPSLSKMLLPVAGSREQLAAMVTLADAVVQAYATVPEQKIPSLSAQGIKKEDILQHLPKAAIDICGSENLNKFNLQTHIGALFDFIRDSEKLSVANDDDFQAKRDYSAMRNSSASQMITVAEWLSVTTAMYQEAVVLVRKNTRATMVAKEQAKHRLRVLRDPIFSVLGDGLKTLECLGRLQEAYAQDALIKENEQLALALEKAEARSAAMQTELQETTAALDKLKAEAMTMGLDVSAKETRIRLLETQVKHLEKSYKQATDDFERMSVASLTRSVATRSVAPSMFSDRNQNRGRGPRGQTARTWNIAQDVSFCRAAYGQQYTDFIMRATYFFNNNTLLEPRCFQLIYGDYGIKQPATQLSELRQAFSAYTKLLESNNMTSSGSSVSSGSSSDKDKPLCKQLASHFQQLSAMLISPKLFLERIQKIKAQAGAEEECLKTLVEFFEASIAEFLPQFQADKNQYENNIGLILPGILNNGQLDVAKALQQAGSYELSKVRRMEHTAVNYPLMRQGGGKRLFSAIPPKIVGLFKAYTEQLSAIKGQLKADARSTLSK